MDIYRVSQNLPHLYCICLGIELRYIKQMQYRFAVNFVTLSNSTCEISENIAKVSSVPFIVSGSTMGKLEYKIMQTKLISTL